MRNPIRAVVAVAAAAALALTPAAAFAQSYSHVDAAGDMAFEDGAASAATNGDATGLAVNYAKRSFTTTATMTDVDVSGSNGVGLIVAATNVRNGKMYLFAGFADSTGTDKFYLRSKGKGKCKKLRVSVDAESNTVTLKAPSSCVDSSKRIVVSATAISDDGSEMLSSDDPLLDGWSETEIGMSPVIARGGTGVVVDPPSVRKAYPGVAKALKKALEKALARF